MQKRTGWTIAGATMGGIVAARTLLQKRRERTRNSDIRVLIIGAGVIGSTYACHLANQGLNVTLLASDNRFQHLAVNGIHVQNVVTRRRQTGPVHVVATVPADEEFDLIILAVRYDQLCAAFERVRPFIETTPLLFLQNNLMGTKAVIKDVEADSFLLGFPGTAGIGIGGTACSLPLWCGTTLIGESQNVSTQRLHQTALILRRAGLRVQVKKDIASWLRTHAATITVLAGCIYRNGGTIRQLGEREGQIRLYQETLEEVFHLMERADMPTAASIRRDHVRKASWLTKLPVRLAGLTPWTSLLIDGYVQDKANELHLFYDQLLSLTARSGTRAPNLRSLAPYYLG